VDGISESITTLSNTLGSKTILSSGDFNINGRTNGSYLMNMFMSDVAIYNKALSLTEIQNIYNSGAPIDNRQLSSSSNLVGYWRMGGHIRYDATKSGTLPVVLNSESA